MTAARGWPARPGYPESPEFKGWHHLCVNGRETCKEWWPSLQAWDFGRMVGAQEAASRTDGTITYLGHVAPPGAVAAARDAALEKAAAAGEDAASRYDLHDPEAFERAQGALAVVGTIRALKSRPAETEGEP